MNPDAPSRPADGTLSRSIPHGLIGMIHVQALPGSPRHARSMPEIIGHALAEATLLAKAGFDALLVENMHDVPYLRRRAQPQTIAAMTAVTREIVGAVNVPVGVQILAGANLAALAVAQSAGASFIRAEGFVFAAVADEGFLDEADAGPLLRFRRQIGADEIAVLADIKKKHSAHAITADVGLAATARAAAFFGADGVVVTGSATGEATSLQDIEAARSAGLPVVVGSGASPNDAPALLDLSHAIIVGSYLKEKGHWANPIDPKRVKAFLEACGR